MKLCEPTQVHSYQDEKKNFTLVDLPSKSQLNIYCDRLATREISALEQPITKIPFLPASRIMTEIDNIAITKRYSIKNKKKLEYNGKRNIHARQTQLELRNFSKYGLGNILSYYREFFLFEE